MSSGILNLFRKTMLLTGVILAPTIRADALSDLGDLTTIINTAASTIGAPQNSSGGSWAISSPVTGADRMTKWLNATDNNQAFVNLTEKGLDDPYIEYVSTLPTLASALTNLGRSWHREMNKPVNEAISALQETVTTFQTSLITAGLIHSNATLRTIRSSGTLENAQVAWGRILNLPGAASAGAPASNGIKRSIAERDDNAGATIVEITLEEALTGSQDNNDKRQDREPPPSPLYLDDDELRERDHPPTRGWINKKRQAGGPPPSPPTPTAPSTTNHDGATVVEITLEAASPPSPPEQPVPSKVKRAKTFPTLSYSNLATPDSAHDGLSLGDSHHFGKFKKLGSGQLYSHKDLWGDKRKLNTDTAFTSTTTVGSAIATAYANSDVKVLGEEATPLFEGSLRFTKERRMAVPFEG